MNLLFWNVSLKPGVRLLDVEFPESYLSGLAGPKLGLKVFDQPASVGTSSAVDRHQAKGIVFSQFGKDRGRVCAGGGDLVKDDHNLVESTFDAFRARVEACQQAVLSKTPPGQKCLYFPNLSGPLRDLERQQRFCESGIRCPCGANIAGLETSAICRNLFLWQFWPIRQCRVRSCRKGRVFRMRSGYRP